MACVPKKRNKYHNYTYLKERERKILQPKGKNRKSNRTVQTGQPGPGLHVTKTKRKIKKIIIRLCYTSLQAHRVRRFPLRRVEAFS